MKPSALVIGGTGPTGHFIVNGLRARGHAVSILHTGRHEIPEIPDDVEHIHTDPYDEAALKGALGQRTFDVCVATYGRLRRTAEIMRGRTGRFVSVGGVPAYLGFMNPRALRPAGLPVPTGEDSPLVRNEGDDGKGYRIVRSEEAVLEAHPSAAHFRYPMVYGPYQPAPREWCVVKRILDGRRQIILADDGLTLQIHGYVENLAHAVLLAVDHPEASAGQIYNCGDEETLTLRQIVELIAEALGQPLEIVTMPWKLATPARPLVGQPLPTHRVLDLAKLRHQLGYRDRVPAREAIVHTARWLVEHPPELGGLEETVLQDPFDYAAEDRLIGAWERALASIPDPDFTTPPGYGMAYSGPGGRAPSKSEFS
ncbi:NAD-dependent epimerase/dehydratase family protein [Myxococcota bacterium]|nr:NAD-dependent epimerase/dehydratase family protein [Myxococcota bacterium]